MQSFKQEIETYFNLLDAIFKKLPDGTFSITDKTTYSSFVCFNDFIKNNPISKRYFDSQSNETQQQLINYFIQVMREKRNRPEGYYIPDVHLWTNYEQFRNSTAISQ